MAIQIQIQDETWQELMSRKTKPSDTFDIIINRLIENERTKNNR